MPLDADIAALSAVSATLNYLEPMAEKPVQYVGEPPPGRPRNNARYAATTVDLRDLRPARSAFSLDGQGFAALDHRSAFTDFASEEAVARRYFPETAELLTAVTGADRVLIFDATIRRRIPGAEDRQVEARQPATRVHVDQTVRSGPQRVRDLLPDEAEHLLAGRVQIINVWRPLRGPVLDHPLALADAASVAPADLVAADLVYADRVGEIYQVLANPAHRWFYLSEMRPDEVLLLKCYDSLTDGRARFAPHCAFADPTAPADAPPRESIEIRSLVFHR